MATPTIPHRSRVRNTVTGATGTLVDQTAGTGDYGVLPDTGPKRLVTWVRGETERTGAPVRGCSRCDARDHHTFDCPEG